MDLNSNERERPERFTSNLANWELLVAAVVKLACEDYKHFSAKGRQGIERFIRSDYFRLISRIDPDWLIKNLRTLYPIRTVDIKGEQMWGKF